MDYAKALNRGLGLQEPILPNKANPHAPIVKQARKAPAPPVVSYIPNELPAFDIATWVMPDSLKEALNRFPGSILNVSPINGAIEFIFGK